MVGWVEGSHGGGGGAQATLVKEFANGNYGHGHVRQVSRKGRKK